MTDTVPLWMRSLAKLPGKMAGAAGGELAEGYMLAREAWGEPDHNQGLAAFAYLWRRFGPPPAGYDPYKDLCCYYLGTPRKDVVLWVRPGANILCGVGYLVTRRVTVLVHKPQAEWERAFQRWYLAGGGERTSDAYTAARFDPATTKRAVKSIGPYPIPNPHQFKPGGWRKTTGIVRDVNQALFDALLELLRPVRIRDYPVNILGRCDHAKVEAEPSKFCGMGVPLGAMLKATKA